jgi:ABC-type lipoprotein release transport system permease subunit
MCAQGNVSSLDVNTSALVRLRDKKDAAAVRPEWEAQGLAVTDPETPNSVGLLRDLRAVPVVVGAVVAVLGTAAAHALVLTARRQRHDLAVLRAFGLRPRQAGSVIRWQAATLAVVALVVVLPLGLVAGRLVWAAIAGPSNVVVRADVRVIGLAMLVAGVLVIAMVVSIWPAHRAARLLAV